MKVLMHSYKLQLEFLRSGCSYRFYLWHAPLDLDNGFMISWLAVESFFRCTVVGMACAKPSNSWDRACMPPSARASLCTLDVRRAHELAYIRPWERAEVMAARTTIGYIQCLHIRYMRCPPVSISFRRVSLVRTQSKT